MEQFNLNPNQYLGEEADAEKLKKLQEVLAALAIEDAQADALEEL